MEKKSKKAEISKFCKDHAAELILGGIGIGCATCLAIAGYKSCKEMKNDGFVTLTKIAKRILPDSGYKWYESLFSMDTQHGGYLATRICKDQTITISDLGKLGECMIQNGCDATQKISDVLVSFAE